MVDEGCLRKSIGLMGNADGRVGGFGGKILIRVRICVLFNAMAGMDDESNWEENRVGFAIKTGDMND